MYQLRRNKKKKTKKNESMEIGNEDIQGCMYRENIEKSKTF